MQPPFNTSSIHETLRHIFGYHEFRAHQEEIVKHVAEGGSGLVLMPTGGGKSLCYQIPALVRPGLGVVISPLIALMQDQVATLRELGVKAAMLNSTLSPEESYELERDILGGKVKLIYLAPERLLQPRTLELLEQVQLALFAIDEAHCVSQWGHDFREEYLALSLLAEKFPTTPRLALTATADETTRREIIEKLGLKGTRTFISGFDRPNIRYRVGVKTETRKQLLNLIQHEHAEDAGIVYCMTRNKVDETAAWLLSKGIKALPYHAGLASEERTKNQTSFIQDEGVVMVATIAFGMGIDKPNVRFVAHLDLPKSMEAYYQETGRAGRDGLPATAWMVYGLQDVVMLRQMMSSSSADEQHKFLENRKLNAILGFCETTECRRKVLLRYFGENYSGQCNNCDTCLNQVQRWEGSVEAQQALSAVFRTGQRFGAKYVIEVLRGVSDERITRFGHDKLSVFGIGSKRSQEEWSSIFRQLTAAGYLTVDMSGYGSLLLTAEAKAVLKGATQVFFRHDPQINLPKRSSVSSRSRDKTKSLPAGSIADHLLRALKAKRLELAKTNRVPPYVIFHDATLVEMARLRPTTSEQLRKISGVGDVKLQRYGHYFLAIITEAAQAAA